jgi:hypothetical protein
VPNKTLVSKLRQAGSDFYSKKRGDKDHLEKKFVTVSFTLKRCINGYQRVASGECRDFIRALGITEGPIIPKL